MSAEALAGLSTKSSSFWRSQANDPISTMEWLSLTCLARLDVTALRPGVLGKGLCQAHDSAGESTPYSIDMLSVVQSISVCIFVHRLL